MTLKPTEVQLAEAAAMGLELTGYTKVETTDGPIFSPVYRNASPLRHPASEPNPAQHAIEGVLMVPVYQPFYSKTGNGYEFAGWKLYREGREIRPDGE